MAIDPEYARAIRASRPPSNEEPAPCAGIIVLLRSCERISYLIREVLSKIFYRSYV